MTIPDLPPPCPPPSSPPAMENEDGSYTVGNEVFAVDEIEVNPNGTVTIDGKTYRTTDFVASDTDNPDLTEPNPTNNSCLTTEAKTNPWFNSNLIARLFDLVLEYAAAASRDRLSFADIMTDMFKYMMSSAEDLAKIIIEMGDTKAKQKWLEVAQAGISIGANARALQSTRGTKVTDPKTGNTTMQPTSQADVQRTGFHTSAWESGAAAVTKGVDAGYFEQKLATLEAEKIIKEELLKINDQTINTISEAISFNANTIQTLLDALIKWTDQLSDAHSLKG